MISDSSDSLLLAVENIGYVFCAKPWHFILSLCVGSLHPSAPAAVQGMLTSVGDRAGLKQGELQGAIANCRSVGMIVAPMWWSTVYEVGMRRGWTSAIYLVAAAIQGLNLVLTAGLRFA